MESAINPRVVLVSMPWAPVTEPSLGLGILHAQLKAAGISSRVLHANTALLRYVTFETYVLVADMWALNEFVFTELLSPGVDEKQLHTLVDRCVTHLSGRGRSESRYATVQSLVEMFLRFRDEVAPIYLQECAAEILSTRPTLVGLTCLFDQTLASVALARLIKEKEPDTLVALGGYALQGPPGEQVLRAFPWVDCIALGDGEPIIEPLARASVGDGLLDQIPGLLLRGSTPVPARRVDLDASPDPDYEDWFTDITTLKDNCDIQIRSDTLPVESSRGCWWGQNKHCVFCGIDEETLKFRHKSSDRVLAMLASMRRNYGEYQFRFSDYILPRPYYEQLLPNLAAISPTYHLKCEIKANQTPERVQRLAKAGFRELQPGIESFSSSILRLMDKGVTGIQNVALLKYGYQERVVIHYNFLYGLPGEAACEYRQMLSNMPRIYHLFPPVSRTEAIVTRFAPMHANPGLFGSAATPRHHRCYDTLFGEDMIARTGMVLDDYAYYFERYLDFDPEMQTLYAQAVMQINHWKKRHREHDVYLGFERCEDALCFHDSRFGESRDVVLSTLEGAAYLACDRVPTVTAQLVDHIASAENCSVEDVTDAMSRLEDERLVWNEGKHVFGLGIPWEIVRERVDSRWSKEWTAVFY